MWHLQALRLTYRRFTIHFSSPSEPRPPALLFSNGEASKLGMGWAGGGGKGNIRIRIAKKRFGQPLSPIEYSVLVVNLFQNL